MSKPAKSLDGADASALPTAPSAPSPYTAPPGNEQMWGRNNTNNDVEAGRATNTTTAGDEDVRMCRICLETDDTDALIAPCKCKGTAKYCHRSCLDEWRVHEHDRAFSTCTECHFQYHFEPTHHRWKLRTRFCWFVSRDVCLITAAVQLAICFLAWLVRVVDQANGQVLLQAFGGGAGCSSSSSGYDDYTDTTSSSSWWCPHAELAVYYTYGLLVLLVGLGIFGSVFLCNNNCQVPDLNDMGNGGNAAAGGGDYVAAGDGAGVGAASAQEQYQQQNNYNYGGYQEPNTQYVQHRDNNTNTARGAAPSSAGYHQADDDYYQDDRTQFYRRRRHGRRYGRGFNNCCMPRYGYYPYYYGGGPYYYGTPGGDCCCCCIDCMDCCTRSGSTDCSCCCHPAIRHHYHNYTSSSSGGGGGNSRGGGGNSDNDAAHILLVILLIAIIIMAIIGLLVGIFLAVMIGQRIVQRHMMLLEKTRLVDDFPVKDLSKYNLDASSPQAQEQQATPLDHLAPVPPPEHATRPVGSTIYDAIPVPPPPARALPAEDASHLRKLGLMD